MVTFADVYVSIGGETIVFFSLESNEYVLVENPQARLSCPSTEMTSPALEDWCREVAQSTLRRDDLVIVISDNRQNERKSGSGMVLWRERAEQYFIERGTVPSFDLWIQGHVFRNLRQIVRLAAEGRMLDLLKYTQVPLGAKKIHAPHAYADNVLRAVVDQTALFSGKIECLAASSVMVRMLRVAGWPAKLCIGVCHVPFEAHAWCELDSVVLGDIRQTKDQLNLLFGA